MKTFKQLKATADDLFRKIVHANHPDRVICPTCGDRFHNNEMQVGHAFRRNELSVRYTLKAATLQCQPCNYQDKDLKPHFRKLYPGWDNEMSALRRKMVTKWELEVIVNELKKQT